MKKRMAIHAVAVALDLFEEDVRRQAAAIERLGEDKERIVEALSKLKAAAKQIRQQPQKSYESPYAKFDRMRKRKHR